LPRVEFGRLRRKSFRGLDEQIPVCKASYAGS
jgi:hypothetical protein